MNLLCLYLIIYQIVTRLFMMHDGVIISEQDVTDNISHKLLPVISKPLANSFNISLSKSIFSS